MKSIWYYDTPIGPVGLAEQGGRLKELRFGRGEPQEQERLEQTPLLQTAARQLEEYFAGARTHFDLPLDPEGTPFERSVWKALEGIPYGETRTYGEIARQLGRPTACRAVGHANGKNPLAIFLPCHRVIGTNGKLTGYAGGLDIKRKLLMLEGIRLDA